MYPRSLDDCGDGTFDHGPFHALPKPEEGWDRNNQGTTTGVSQKREAHDAKLKLREKLLSKREMQTDLTDGQVFDWRMYIQGLSDQRQELICRGDISRIVRFSGEIHPTADCPWTHLPLFHFVAVDSSGLRVLIDQTGEGHVTVFFETEAGTFLSVQQRPSETGDDFVPVTTIPADKHICEAFGARSMDGRQLKNMLAGRGVLTFRGWVEAFLKERDAIPFGKGQKRRHADVEFSLVDAARHLVHFSGVHLRWELNDDRVKQQWWEFLYDKHLHMPEFRNQKLPSRVSEYVVHKRIGEAMRNFQQHAGQGSHVTEQAWQSLKEVIGKCPDCREQYEKVLSARSSEEAASHLSWYLWTGKWNMKVQSIRFTHDSISFNFRNRQPVTELVEQLQRDPRYIESVQPLNVMYYHGNFHSINNRRLWSFKEADRLCSHEALTCRVIVHSPVSPWKCGDLLFKFFDAFSTQDHGISVEFPRWRPPGVDF